MASIYCRLEKNCERTINYTAFKRKKKGVLNQDIYIKSEKQMSAFYTRVGLHPSQVQSCIPPQVDGGGFQMLCRQPQSSQLWGILSKAKLFCSPSMLSVCTDKSC